MSDPATRRGVLALGAGGLLLSGCAALRDGAAHPADILAHGLTAAQVVQLYQAAKGVAEIAATVDPTIAPWLALAVAVTDPLAARVASGQAASDIEALQRVANAVLLRTVALVRVVPADA